MVLGALELLFEVEKGGGGPFWEFNPLFIFYLIYTFFRPICVPNQPKNAPGPYVNLRRNSSSISSNTGLRTHVFVGTFCS